MVTTNTSAPLTDTRDVVSVADRYPSAGPASGFGGVARRKMGALAWWLLSNVAGGGQIQLEITNNMARTWHLVVVFGSGQQAASPAITFT